MTIKYEAVECTEKTILEYFTTLYGALDSEFEIGLTEDARDGLIMVDERPALSVRFHSSNKIPPIGYTRVDDVKYGGATFRCYIKWSENQ